MRFSLGFFLLRSLEQKEEGKKPVGRNEGVNEGMNESWEKIKSQLRQPARFKSRGGSGCRKSLSPEIQEAAQGTREKNQQKAEWRREKCKNQISE